MPSIKDIRTRISSVKSTQQITKAMKMVSAAKLRRAQQAIEGARTYSLKLSEMGDDLMVSLAKDFSGSELKMQLALSQLNPLLAAKTVAEGETKKVGLVVVASDRGLCGGYNSMILRFAMRKYVELTKTPGVEVKLFFVGRKAAEYFRKRGIQGHNFENFWAGKFDIARADAVTKLLTSQFLAGDLHEVLVCYTQFQSALSQIQKEQRLLPMALDAKELLKKVDAAQGAGARSYVVEPEAKKLFSEMIPSMLRMKMYSMLADSLASEYGSRMTAMDNATRNAGDMISKLTLYANRLRQAAITKELMEIIGGAEALKG